MSKQLDMTPQPDLSQKTGTGPVRTRLPVWRPALPPCNNACPAGENIQAWLALAEAGRFEAAWQRLIEENPLPAVHGRVCYHPCESACNRAQVDDAVSIHAIERFLGDEALARGWQPAPPAPASGKKVLVIGAGPSGLSCAWHLNRLGHQVEIREAGPLAGGMLRFGIPAYRLPRDVLDREVARIVAAGVTLTLNHKVEDVLKVRDEGGFDAVFMAIGAHLAKRVDIPAREAGKILDAMSFLEQASLAEEKGLPPPKLGRRVAIYGGGNTAMDAARTARRLGVEEAMIIYRRDRDHMPAHAFEAFDAEEEGIKINWLRTIRQLDSTNIEVEVMALDAEGKPVPTGKFETLEADSLILALGQEVDLSVLESIPGVRVSKEGVVQVGENLMTDVPGLFAGGDMVPSERTVTIATGHGKKAARHMDAWLRGRHYHKPLSHLQAGKPLVGPEQLQLWFQTHAPASSQPVKPPSARDDFGEIIGGLDEVAARYEAARCYSCGNCFECDGCYGSCPEQAIAKLGPGLGYQVDAERCTGCGACHDQCPCHAIELRQPEESQ
ncbi:NAD(P)-binding protein [Aeromonas caviae]|uniref:NAD(P)-binding protein n=1 Tax=Aeromonas caviae TaxID=648 RepID=UPI0015E00A73|nr:NAD(P)-binding protein [Aeromonas caviae]MCR3928569.1 NAD(P)-binding protein [Aeromonas caviae]MDX7755734.1 NAD(P)-binding protein [Aeromonas caviae]MDX7776273.1 NAD(P)-binding protein [Aeromonas caviae]QLL88016.1 FAD-dependent oxidoreductase [Aeromonas caviae]GJA13589.1 glutamate synthase [Aeromonas caviae]